MPLFNGRTNLSGGCGKSSHREELVAETKKEEEPLSRFLFGGLNIMFEVKLKLVSPKWLR